ncbi:permease [Pelagibaculum spongiae]|uniref:Permease n=1 Tax=Pelagibaculum spongiae TaxID=2080658 RepID=A0A2V1H1Q5_9GAMM|nr:permease [Pelagibaculum spongiae]PVZ70311.1 hypothetical protein DC094_06870 [Pelagibaculum spongiae]
MLEVFSWLADLLTYQLMGLDPQTKAGSAIHFFIEDTTKILALLVVMIYLLAIVRASLDTEKVRDILARKNRFFGYFAGSMFGAVTPFCSCSSIPLFLGFTTAGIPFGITLSFLLTSPLINEVAVVLLWGLLGWKFTLVYVLVGLVVGIIGGAFMDAIKAERYVQPFVKDAFGQNAGARAQSKDWDLKARHQFASYELKAIFSRVWKWVFIGVGVGALLHGYVPEQWVEEQLGSGQWWSVPVAVVMGIPLYANATGVIPVMESLLLKGLPVGTTLAFCMSIVGASFPEFILLKQVMKLPLLIMLFFMLLTTFTLVGWLFNGIGFVI